MSRNRKEFSKVNREWESRPPFDLKNYEALKNQLEFYLESLKRLKLENDQKEYKSLLDNLYVYLQCENTSWKNSTKKLDFTNEVQYLTQFILMDLRTFIMKDDNFYLVNIYEVQASVLKNVYLLLQMNSSMEDNLYHKMVEGFLDDLIQYRQLLCDIDCNDPRYKTFISAMNTNIHILLKCISIVVADPLFLIPEISKNSLCSKFIGVVRSFSFYGLESYDIKTMSQHLYPSMLKQIGKGQELTHRKKKPERKPDVAEDDEDGCDLYNLNDSNLSSFSATEYSSSEMEDNNYNPMNTRRNRQLCTDIRVVCYELLSFSIQIFTIRNVFGFWSFFFPEKFEITSQSKQFTVLWTILKDSSNRVKREALTFMFDFFNYGKFFIKTLVNETKASESAALKNTQPPSDKQYLSKYRRIPQNPVSSFTTISQSLTMMIKELHVFFDRIMFLETKNSILIQIYKVITLIVTITPYNKISTNILYQIFDRNSYFLHSKILQIKNLSLVLFVKMFTPELLPKEFRLWLTESTAGPKVMNKIFKNCFEFIRNSEHMLLSSESIKLLSAIVKHHGAMIDLFNADLLDVSIIHSLKQISIEMLNSERFYNNSVLQCLVCKFVYTFGMFLKHLPNKNLEKIFENNDKKIEFITDWFLQVFESKTFFITLIEPDSSKAQNSSQVTLINSISLIPDEVFVAMEQSVQYRTVALLMSLANSLGDSDLAENSPGRKADAVESISSDTKSAAIRCLSILQSLQPLCFDANLIVDIFQICLEVLDITLPTTSNKKKTIFLLENTLWPLANVLDGVKKRRLEGEIEMKLLRKIIVALNRIYDVKNSNYTEDILVNLARCSGLAVYLAIVKWNLIEISTGDLFKETGLDKLLMETVANMINLLSSTKLFKLQWNICISFTYPLQLARFSELCLHTNSLNPEKRHEQTMLDDIFYAVFEVFKTSENHKVQSHAIYTICSILPFKWLKYDITEIFPLFAPKIYDGYHSVPLHSRQSWIERYNFALIQILDYVFKQNKQAEFERKYLEHINLLFIFLRYGLTSSDVHKISLYYHKEKRSKE